jgi:hypothetical protein
MSLSRLLPLTSSVEENYISDYIEKDFKKLFDTILLSEDLLFDSSSEDENNNNNNNNNSSSSRRPRNYKPPGKSDIKDYFKETAWGRLISNEKVKDPSTSCGKLFRTRFRLPFVVFEFLVKISSEFNLFEYSQTYKVSIPDELKVMAILRMLGRGECLDSISEMSGIGKSTVQRIFKTWTHNFVKYCKGDFLKIPEGDELKEIMEVYKKVFHI